MDTPFKKRPKVVTGSDNSKRTQFRANGKRHINARDLITFQGTTAEEIMLELRVSVDVYLEFCADQGKTPDNPNAGHLVLNIDPELQTEMIQAARREHENLDAWIVERLAAGV